MKLAGSSLPGGKEATLSAVAFACISHLYSI